MSFGSTKPLTIQRMLSNASEGVFRSFERLSSGQRINTASDDAAGLAVADNLRVKSRLYNIAVRNINDGLSAMNIMNGALEQQSLLATRLAELAEQAANGSLSSLQRKSLDVEYQALLKESSRIGAVTSFNGVQLLMGTRDGNGSSIALQVDIGSGSDSRILLNKIDTSSYSGTFNLSSASLSSAQYNSWIVSNFGRDSFSTEELQNVFGGSMARVSTTDSNGVTREVLIAVAGVGNGGGGLSLLAFAQSTTNPDVWENTINSDDFDDWTAGGNALFNSSGQIVTNGGIVTLNSSGASGDVSVALDLRGLTVSGSSIPYGVLNNNAATTSIDFTNVLSQSSARAALDVSRQRIEELAKMRGDLGAVENRLGTALGLVKITRENTTAAESRIRDVDISEESSNLIAQSVKQQVASALLSQSNLEAQIILTLI